MAAFNAKTNVGWSHREGLFNTCLGFSGQSQKHGGQTKQVESLRKIEGSRTEPAQSHHLVRGGLRPCHTTFRTILQTKERTQTPTTITNGPTLTIVFHHFPPPQVFFKEVQSLPHLSPQGVIVICEPKYLHNTCFLVFFRM